MKPHDQISFEERVRRRNERRAIGGGRSEDPEDDLTIRRSRGDGPLKSLAAISLYFLVIAVAGGVLITQFAPQLTTLVDSQAAPFPILALKRQLATPHRRSRKKPAAWRQWCRNCPMRVMG